MSALTVCSRQDAPEMFARWECLPEFSGGLSHPSRTPSGNQYYAATLDKAVDTSFAIVRDDKPLMLVHCNLLNGNLGYFIHPISLLANTTISDGDRSAAISAALKTVDDVAVQGAASVSLREEIVGSQLSALGKACVNRGATPHIMQSAACDLSLEEEEIRRNTRKSFQSLINWGRRSLSIRYFNAANPDQELFDIFRDFHAKIAGRITRPEKSWQAMRRWILESGGELALAYLADKQLVAGTMTTDGQECSLYASGVYDRTQFDKPLAHFPLYDAIIRSRARGLKYYDLGDLPFKGSVSDKEYNIGFFKRGFATRIPIHIVWKWEVAG